MGGARVERAPAPVQLPTPMGGHNCVWVPLLFRFCIVEGGPAALQAGSLFSGMQCGREGGCGAPWLSTGTSEAGRTKCHSATWSGPARTYPVPSRLRDFLAAVASLRP